MEVLVRQIRQGPGGTSDFIDSAVDVGEISIGSAADSTIQLLGRLVANQHAVIQRTGSALRLRCLGGNRVEINGRSTASQSLAFGDQIQVGGHVLTLLQPPPGFEAAIQVKPDAGVAASDFESAFRTDLERTSLSKRAASWIAVALIGLFGLAIPLAILQLHKSGAATPVLLPDDAVWSGGPLTPAHAHATAGRCNTCHQHLFLRVRDSACLECHKAIRDHVSTDHRVLTHLGEPQRCAECHREHDERAPRLIVDDDRLCVACHAESDKSFGSLKVQRVSGFEKLEHPAFSVSLQRLNSGATDAGSNLEWSTYRVPLAGAMERSNLKFSHAQHLDESKVTRNSGTGPLGCGDCHIPTADGLGFQPITMGSSCSSCHELNFDLSAPSRQLPHGKPLDAMLMIEDYFARKFSDPLPVQENIRARRTPDLARDPSRLSDVDVCNGPAVTCARQRARSEIENQFTGRGCVSCHVVLDTHGGELHERFQVTPVRLGSRYFPEVVFDHKLHRVQDKLTGDAACESCHPARRSTLSRDLLLPDIDTCLKCHRDRTAGGGGAGMAAAALLTIDDAGREKPKIVTLQCISCHVYHPPAISAFGRGMQ